MFRYQPGVSLIEMMIAIVIMSILIVMGVPAFSTFLANTKVRASAESLLAGLQLARADAVRRNSAVEFMLTADAPIASGVAAATASITGRNWIVRTQDAATFIEGRQADEGSAQVVVGTTAESIVFNGFGGANPAATFGVSNPAGGACAPAGPIRCLNVTVSTGGRIRMCDPAVDAVAHPEDTRGCN